MKERCCKWLKEERGRETELQWKRKRIRTHIQLRRAKEIAKSILALFCRDVKGLTKGWHSDGSVGVGAHRGRGRGGRGVNGPLLMKAKRA